MTVIFRSKNDLITARLEFEGNRAFAVLEDYVQKSTGEVIKSERIELETEFLQQSNSGNIAADYVYGKDVDLPDPSKN